MTTPEVHGAENKRSLEQKELGESSVSLLKVKSSDLLLRKRDANTKHFKELQFSNIWFHTMNRKEKPDPQNSAHTLQILKKTFQGTTVMWPV